MSAVSMITISVIRSHVFRAPRFFCIESIEMTWAILTKRRTGLLSNDLTNYPVLAGAEAQFFKQATDASSKVYERCHCLPKVKK